MFNIDSDDYTKLYIKRQEQLLLEQIKKGIDTDVKLTVLTSLLEDLRKQFEETKAQLDMQIDIANQAANGLQESMSKNQQLENLITSLRGNIADLDKKYLDSVVLRDNLAKDLDSCNRKNEGLEKELVRQRDEMQEIFDENKELKTKKTINKKKPVEDDSDF
jgi:septal ring factor EnvC (AmiA/AmiB activator)